MRMMSSLSRNYVLFYGTTDLCGFDLMAWTLKTEREGICRMRKSRAGGEPSSRDAGSFEGPRTAPHPNFQPAEN